MQANHMIQQVFDFLGEHEKPGHLVRLLEREMDGSRILVFCETKRGCDAVTRQLRTEGWPALSIHGLFLGLVLHPTTCEKEREL